MTTKALEPQIEPLVLAPFSVGFMVTQNILVDSQVYLNDPYVVLMALSLLLRSLLFALMRTTHAAMYLPARDGLDVLPQSLYLLMHLSRSASHSCVPYLSHILLVHSSSVSFRHSMNYINRNLAELLSPSPAWMEGRGDGRNDEIC